MASAANIPTLIESTTITATATGSAVSPQALIPQRPCLQEPLQQSVPESPQSWPSAMQEATALLGMKKTFSNRDQAFAIACRSCVKLKQDS